MEQDHPTTYSTLSMSANDAVTSEGAVLIRELIAADEASLARLQISKQATEQALQAASTTLRAKEMEAIEANSRLHEAIAFETAMEGVLCTLNKLEVRKESEMWSEKEQVITDFQNSLSRVKSVVFRQQSNKEEAVYAIQNAQASLDHLVTSLHMITGLVAEVTHSASQKKRRLRSFTRIPTEIWREIFRQVTSQFGESIPNLINEGNLQRDRTWSHPVILGSVCRSWRGIVSHDSEVWRNFVLLIDSGGRYSEKIFYHYLRQAGNRFKEFGIACTFAISTDIRHRVGILLESIEHIAKLHYSVNSIDNHLLWHLPPLTALHIHGNYNGALSLKAGDTISYLEVERVKAALCQQVLSRLTHLSVTCRVARHLDSLSVLLRASAASLQILELNSPPIIRTHSRSVVRLPRLDLMQASLYNFVVYLGSRFILSSIQSLIIVPLGTISFGFGVTVEQIRSNQNIPTHLERLVLLHGYSEGEIHLIMEYMRYCTSIKTLAVSGGSVERMLTALGDTADALSIIISLEITSYEGTLENIERIFAAAPHLNEERRREDGMDIEEPRTISPFSQPAHISFNNCPLITPEMAQRLNKTMCQVGDQA